MRLQTSLRSRAPAETLDVARRLMRPLGVSRLIDATRLDRLGLPVFISVRPRGQTSRVHAGKGLEPLDAQVGALMEGLEFAVAERAGARGPDLTLPLSDLQARLPGGLRWADFAPLLGAALHGDRPTPAMRCENLTERRSVLLPAELVMVPGPAEAATPLFGWSTNGLASGNTLEEATLHALLEVLERDAVAMYRERSAGDVLDPSTLPGAFAARAADWHRLGIALHVRRLPSEFDLPCFEATLHEPGHPQVPLARGFGLHADRTVALSRAISEAAQSRVSLLHRADPDNAALYADRAPIRSQGDALALRQLVDELGAPGRGSLPFDQVAAPAPRSIRGTLRDLLALLSSRGFGPVFRHRMKLPDGPDLLGLHVVKVVVPRCEIAMGGPVRMGVRLLARVISQRRPA